MKATVETLKQEVKDQKALCQEIWATASAHSEEYRTALKRYNRLADRLSKLTHPRRANGPDVVIFLPPDELAARLAKIRARA